MPIQLKRSAVAGKVPTTAQLSLGELAVNTNDGRLFLKKDDGTEEIVELLTDISPHRDADNSIINGAFDFWQRGFSGTGNGYVAADRWVNIGSGGTFTQSLQTHVLGSKFGSNSPKNYLRQLVTGQSAAAHLAATQQRVEGVRSYAGEVITVLGWARRSSGSGNMVVEAAQTFGSGGSPSPQVAGISPKTITLTANWEPFAAVLTIPSIAGKTLGSNNNDYFELNFWISAGSDWSARTNSLGIQTIGVDLWGIHIRRGDHKADATDFYRAPELGPELARCQRYFCVTNASARFWAAAGNYFVDVQTYWPVTMRATPSVSRSGTFVNCVTPFLNNPGTAGVRFGLQSLGAGDTYALVNQVFADAEL